MFREGNLHLNSVQKSSEMLKKELQQTVLNQEHVFRTQVLELHRLYKVQKSLMEECQRKELFGLNLQKGCMQSTSVLLANPNTSDSPLKERTFPLAPVADPMWSRNPHSYEEQLQQQQQQGPGLMRRPFDLQLPADEFINLGDDCLVEKGVRQNYFMNPSEVKNLIRDKHVSNQGEVRLVLGDKVDYVKKERDGSNIYTLCHDVIDLEQPSGCSSNHFAASSAPSRYKNEAGATSQAYTSPYKLGKSCVSVGPHYQKQPSVVSGFGSYPGEIQSANPSNESQFSASGKSTYLDLNTIQPDAYPDICNHSIVANPSIGSSSGAFQQFVFSPSSSCSIRPNPIKKNEMHPPADAVDLNSAAVEGNESGNWTMDDMPSGVNGSKLVHIDLEVEPELPLEAAGKRLCSQNSSPANESVGSKSKASVAHSSDKYEVVDAVEEQIQLENALLEGAENGSSSNSKKSSSPLISDCITGQSSGTRDLKCATEGGSSNFFACNGSLVADSPSGEHEQRSTDTSESYNLCGPMIKLKVVDTSTQKAAELLRHFSLGARNSATEDKMKIEEENQPQHSADSYESLVLNQKELGPEDYCISSNAYDIDADSDKRDNAPYKLKRGTRMRDFQKDLLPVLSTLARHEICEDINIMEGVIRSREYKRMRAKMGLEVGNWSKTVRGRRTRVNYGRRYQGTGGRKL